MNFESNAAKTIAALMVLNVGLFVSNHASVTALAHSPAVRASVAAQRSEICKARVEARMAAMQARLQARAAVREAVRARREVKQAAAMAPSASSIKTRTTVTDYVRCIISSGIRSVSGGN